MDRFWTLPVYDAHTDQISELGLPYGTKPAFDMIVGPTWKGATPAGVAGEVCQDEVDGRAPVGHHRGPTASMG